jgi:biotin transport system substrate-specific component
MEVNVKKMVLAALFAALTAVGAFLKFPLGLTSVSLQFFFTALAGVLLGARWGALSQLVYVALGLVGVPIFTQGGGLGYLFQPSMGFLFGLIPAAWLIGRLAEGSSHPARICLACVAGLAVLYVVALPYMYLILNVYLAKGLPLWRVIRDGMLVYLPGDALKIAVVTLLSPVLSRRLAYAA